MDRDGPRDLSTADPADVEHDRREATDPSAQPEATNGNRGERAGITSPSGGPANRQLDPGSGDPESLIPDDEVAGTGYRSFFTRLLAA